MPFDPSQPFTVEGDSGVGPIPPYLNRQPDAPVSVASVPTPTEPLDGFQGPGNPIGEAEDAYNKNQSVGKIAAPIEKSLANSAAGAFNFGTKVPALALQGLIQGLMHPKEAATQAIPAALGMSGDSDLSPNPQALQQAAIAKLIQPPNSNPSAAKAASISPSTPASPNPPPSTPSSVSVAPKLPINQIIASQIGQNAPQYNGDSKGFSDQDTGIVDRDTNPNFQGPQGSGYREAQPVGPVLWNDLTPEMQQGLISRNPLQAGNLPQMFNEASMARNSNPLIVPNSPDIAQRAAMAGLPIPTGTTADAGKIAQAYGGMMHNAMSGSGGSSGAWAIRPDPVTGQPTWVAVPEGNQSGPTGHPKYEESQIKDARTAYNSSHEAEAFDVTRTAYSQLDSVLKDAMTKPNPSNDLALLKTFAKIDNPTRGITEGNVETEMMNPGYFPGEFEQMKNRVLGNGMLTPQQRQNIYNAAKNSYRGNVNSILQYQNQTILPQMMTQLPNWDPKEIAKGVFGNAPSMWTGTPQGEGGSGDDNAATAQQAEAWLKANPNDPQASAVAQKLQMMQSQAGTSQ
jgi:hypothetical protein